MPCYSGDDTTELLRENVSGDTEDTDSIHIDDALSALCDGGVSTDISDTKETNS